MAVKFSQFVAVSTISSSGYIVGYDGTDNVRIKTSTADTMLSFTGGSMQFSKLTNAMVSTNTIGLNKLVNLTGLSVLGNATNASAAMAAITAANDYEVLMRSGTSLVFSTIGTNNIANAAVTYAKIQNVNPQYILGRNTSPAGAPEEVSLTQLLDWGSNTANTILARGASTWGALTATSNGHVLRLSGGALGFGQIDYTSVSFSATQRVLGRNTAGAGTAEEVTVAQVLEWLSSTANTIAYRNGSAWTALTASTNGHVLRLSGGALGFGTITTGSIDNEAITYAKIQNISATSRVLGRKAAGAGVTEELTASDVLDFLSSTQGSVIYRGSTGWAALAPGTSGQYLKTLGAGANPAWDTPAAGGGGAVSLYNTTTATGPVNTTTKTALFTYGLPTNLVAGDTLKLLLGGVYKNGSGGNATFTITVELGSTIILSGSVTMASFTTSDRCGMYELNLYVASTTSQKVTLQGLGTLQAPGVLGGYNATHPFSLNGYGTAAEDLTTSKTLQVTCTLNVANAATYMYAEGVTLIKYPKP